MQDRLMKVDARGIPAHVYKESEEKDLALVKLTRVPAELKPLPVIGLAREAPRVGEDCVAIGHPAAAMLWTARSGEVSSIGQWPREMIDAVMQTLAASGRERQQLARKLDQIPPRKVVVSTCGLNPGDSGGPLVNAQGELIAVSYAIPRAAAGIGISFDKFSYHVHLDEVRLFLDHRPEKPLPFAPDPWPAAVYAAVLDLDRDGTPDTLAFSVGTGMPPTGLLLDLDQDSVRKLAGKGLDEIIGDKAWDFEFAIQPGPTTKTFYDTDNDGTIDLFLSDTTDDPGAATILKLEQGKWVRKATRQGKLVDPSLIADAAMRNRLIKVLQGLEQLSRRARSPG
jgi:hypothetical protein